MKSAISPLPTSKVSLYFATIFVFLYLRTFLLPGTPIVANGDETIWFMHAMRILQGQVPFRDYLTGVMPGADLFYAAVFRLLGIHAWMASGFLIALGSGVASALLDISRRILTGNIVFLPGVLFVVLDFDSAKDATHHWYSTLLVLMAVSVLIKSRNMGRGLRRVAFAGALCGVAAVFTQSQGLLAAIAIAFYLGRDLRTDLRGAALQLGVFAAPFVALCGGVVGYYVIRAGFAAVYSSLVTFVFHNYPALRADTIYAYAMQVPPHHSVGELTLFIPYLFIHLFVPFGYLFCLYRLWLGKRSGLMSSGDDAWDSMLLINLVGIGLFAAVANAPTYNRMCMVAPLAFVACVWLAKGDARMQRLLWIAAIAFMVVRPVQLQRHWRGYVDLPIGRAATTDPNNYQQLAWFAQHTHPGESFFYSQQLTFVLQLDNPTTIDFPTPTEFTTTQQVDDAIRGLEEHQTPLLGFYDAMYKPRPELFAPGRPRIDNLGPFYSYVYQHYHQVKVLPEMTAWERN